MRPPGTLDFKGLQEVLALTTVKDGIIYQALHYVNAFSFSL